MSHRPAALGAILESIGQAAGGVSVRAVHPKADTNAIRIVVRATKGSHAPLELLPPLVLHDASNAFTREAQALHDGLTF